jgi:cell division cycle protein 20 (cofactor of APC complex)
MTHFGLENEVNSLVRMDAPFTRAPQMRWQRKMTDSFNVSKSDSMINCSSLVLNQSATASSKTPMKTLNISTQGAAGCCRNGSGNSKTPGKTPHKTSKTPNKNITPGRSGSGDRFIPNRSGTQFDLGHYLVTNSNKAGDETVLSPSKVQFQRTMSENLNGADLTNTKIISYQQKPPSVPEGSQSCGLKVLYSHSKTQGSVTKPFRHIPQTPERILDAPDMLDDYYLNLLDWSSTNFLAVCLGPRLYLWNASNGDIHQLLEMDNEAEYVSSVAWLPDGNHLAVGTSTMDVQLWDVQQQKKLRSMNGHTSRVGCLSWNSHILSSGSRSGYIHHHDVRVADHLVGSLAGHSQEVCGLKWSPDGKCLASGGNDNLLNIWPADPGMYYSSSTPIYTFDQHQAAVKAVAWCPWQPSLLASGGGTADRHIRFWNCNTGTCLTSVDTNSQVCALLWSKEYKELVSSHGFAQNQLIIWRYPSLTKVAELSGHTSRVLHMAMSPDGSTVVSAAADETLRLWKCFAVDPEKKAKKVATPKESSSIMTFKSIR